MSELPTFTEATARLQRLLASREAPTNLVWIFREDLVLVRNQPMLRWPLPSGNEELARKHFEQGRTAGLDVALQCLFRSRDRAVCYVWAPRDREEADHGMISGLKLSVAEPLTEIPCWQPSRLRLLPDLLLRTRKRTSTMYPDIPRRHVR